MLSSSELIAKIKSYHPSADGEMIERAYNFSQSSHEGQMRHSGESYFSHPVAVAEVLTELKLDQASIAAALLHDVVEDTAANIEDIEKKFGSEVAKLVNGVTKLSKIESIPSNEWVAENFRKLTLAMSEDIRVLLIKLADRLHNMRTLSHVPSSEKRQRKARESLDIYAPLAARIGLNKIKDELQDLAFAELDPESRNFIISNLNEIRETKQNVIEQIIQDLDKLLREHDIKFEISGREKRPYSIFTKITQKKVGLYMLHDLMAFRIVVNDVTECYRVLGVVNSNYNMIPGSFKDYISTPKDNGYQSLHLAILGPFNKKIEVQIRDQRMHEFAELGLAAHWRYKDKAAAKNKSQEHYRFLQELMALFEHSDSAAEALKHHKLEIHKNEVFCFTPNGDIFNLPQGATVVDFAYAVHSEVGNKCVSAKVNSIIAPLRQKLHNGDQVEIVTANNGKPSPNWLQFVTTSKARNAIRNFIRREKFGEYSSLGSAILAKFFAQRELELNERILTKILPTLRVKSIPDLYVRVAEGMISRYDVLKLTYPEYEEEAKKPKVRQTEKKKKSGYSVPIEGLVDGMAIRYGGCCSPIPGDAIVGVIHTGSGVTIHNQNCANLKNMAINPNAIIDVCFKNDEEYEGKYGCRLRVIMENTSGSLADVSSIIAKKDVNITNLRIVNRNADYFELAIDIEVKNAAHLEEILSVLRISKKIIEAVRI